MGDIAFCPKYDNEKKEKRSRSGKMNWGKYCQSSVHYKRKESIRK